MVAEEKIADPGDDVLYFEDRSRTYSRSGPGDTTSSDTSDAGLSDIVEILYSEHRYLASLLDALEKEAARLRPGKIPDYLLLLDIVDYLTHYPDQYHHPREDLLFSTLLEQDDDFGPLLQRLEREHRTLAVYNHDLFNELTGITTGRAVERPVLQRSLEQYIAAYRQHMDYESREIFPRAKGSLSATDRKKLGEKTQYIDDPLFGGEVQYRYRRLGRKLHARVEVASQELVSSEFSAIQSTIGKLSGVVDTLGDLKNAIVNQGRESWREQRETLRKHAQPGEGPNILFLPLALVRNQGRHWKEGVAEIRQILREGDGGDANAKRNH